MWGKNGMAGGCFPVIAVHSSKNYHHEHTTEPRRPSKDVVAAWDAVISQFHGDSNLYNY